MQISKNVRPILIESFFLAQKNAEITECRNALKMLSLLHTAGMQTSLEKENIGTFADSVAAVMLASLLHDSGMTIGRKGHELYSGIIS